MDLPDDGLFSSSSSSSSHPEQPPPKRRRRKKDPLHSNQPADFTPNAPLVVDEPSEFHPDSVVTWSKRVGGDYQRQVQHWNQTNCLMCFRPNEAGHKCDKRKLSMAQAIDTVLQTNTAEMHRGQSLWVLSEISNHLLTKYLTKATQHRQNSSKTKQAKSAERARTEGEKPPLKRRKGKSKS